MGRSVPTGSPRGGTVTAPCERGPRRTVGPVDADHETDLDPTPTVGVPDPEDPPFTRPVDRFRSTAVGTLMAAGLLGLAEALEVRPPREEVVIVQEAPTQPPLEPRRLEILLDPDHPERSMVFLPEPTDRRDP